MIETPVWDEVVAERGNPFTGQTLVHSTGKRTCPRCGKVRSLRSDGYFYAHGPRSNRCTGVRPTEERLTWRF